VTHAARPPRLASRLLRRVLPDDVRDAIDGDLCELYVRRRSESGTTRARLWYWKETLSLAVRFAPVRLGEMLHHVFCREGLPSALDFKLGGRMLRKYPGLALVGGMGMAVATAIGAGAFTFLNTYVYPDLPLDQGDRVVSIVNWDTRRGTDDPRMALDFVAWRTQSTSLLDVGAFRTIQRNLIDSAGESSAVRVAQMSAAGFRVARATAERGRALIDDDERPGALPVIVIGHDVWTERFHGDPDIVGRTVRLGRVAHTIVGVMPKGFAFPINHKYWVPLRTDSATYAQGRGPALKVFARLAPRATRERAQAELTVIGARMAAARPDTHTRLTPRLMEYADVAWETGSTPWKFMLAQTGLALLLVLVSLNVAVLVYARTVVRAGEIAVRTALGATRARIVTQLFGEALVLSVLAAAVGLALVAVALRFVDFLLETNEGGVPFWVHSGLPFSTVVYTFGLALVGAFVVGVLPALRVTRGTLRATLSALSGGSRPQLGRTWTWMIVTQVTLAVGILPPAMLMGRFWVSQAMTRPGFPADEYLSANLRLDRESNGVAAADTTQSELRNAMRATQLALMERLAADPTVDGITFGAGLPGFHPFNSVGLENSPRGRGARMARVASNYFKVLGVTLVAGRAFRDADVAHPTARPVIVDRTFADGMGVGGEVIGRRVRFPLWGNSGGRIDPAQLEWREIIGIVDDFPAGNIGIEDPGDTRATLYEPVAVGELSAPTLFVHVRAGGPTAALAPRLRAIAAAADPTLQLRDVQSVEQAYAAERRWMRMAALAVVLVVGSVLLLSAAGIYALMSLTVSQRRREIGVRAALGGGARHILMSVLARAALHMAIGVVAGLVLVVAADRLTGGELMSRTGLVVIPVTALFMVAIGMVAAAGPARYGLRIQPTEALRSE
jgi:predicted permease